MDEAARRIQDLEAEVARLRSEREAGGAIIGTLGISRNSTSHQRADTELRVSEAKLRMVFDHAVDGILLGSPEGLVIDANTAVCDLVGRSRAELLGLHISRIFAPESLAATPLRFDLLRAGQRVVSERDLLRLDGSRVPIEMHTKMMPDGTYQTIVRDISDRREAEASYRGLFDSVMEAVYLLGRDGCFLDVNRGAEEMYQRPKAFFIGKSPEALAAPGRNDLRHVKGLLERAFAGEPQCFEFWGVRADGEVFPKEVRVYKGTYFKQDVVIALSQDISQRKRAEQALQASERHYRELLEGLQEGFAFTDTEERFVFANPAASAIFGTPEGLAGHPLRDFLAPEVFEEVLRKTEARKQGLNGQYELPIRRPDGEARVIALSVSPWQDEKGHYLGSRGLFQDVTERRLAENALRESRERYLDLFNNTTDAIFWFRIESDGSLVTESLNPTLEAWLGRTTSQVAGQPIHTVFPRTLADRLEQQCRSCMEAGHPLRYENVVGEGLSPRTFETLLVPIRDGQGRVARLVGFAQDITQHKEAEEAIRQAQKLESLGVLAGGIAHDFNNLLTAMLGNLNLAQLKLPEGSPALAPLGSVERAVLKAAELTQQMLAYSGKGRFVVKAHDLNQVVLEMTHLLKVSISKKVAFRYDLAKELPPIEADAAQLQQVVMNLVTNASEAIGDQEGTIGIATRQVVLDAASLQSAFAGQNLQPGAYVVLEISDNGCGIRPEIKGRIFDPFFSTKQSGRGLGLSAMQGILRGHRAGIQITSAPGRGSTFTLLFPVGNVPSPAASVPIPDRGPRPLRGRILLVDDEPEVRAATADMLEALGLQVVTAVDGLDALERFQAERGSIDLVLLDLTMPRMDGREAFRELRKLRGDLPVILFSGYSEHESLRETLAQGFAGFLPKPFLMADLRNAIQQVQG